MIKMPVIFVGHGSPMNAIEDNVYTRNWEQTGTMLPRPDAILSVSAHWVTQGTRVANSLVLRTVYDMYGFPKELYEVVYRPPGSPKHADMVLGLLKDAQIDNSWGIDHGTWSVLTKMYPKADIPVFQLSLNEKASRKAHFELGRLLKPLREKGVMIMGSGNIVHNLFRVNWDLDKGYPWAYEFDGYIKDRIVNDEYDDVINYQNAGQCAKNAFGTTEHFDPLMYVLGAADQGDRLEVINESCVLGSISMTCYLFGG